MNLILTFTFLCGFFIMMAIGLILKNKVLTKGCSVDPDDCRCRKEGKDPLSCDK